MRRLRRRQRNPKTLGLILLLGTVGFAVWYFFLRGNRTAGVATGGNSNLLTEKDKQPIQLI